MHSTDSICRRCSEATACDTSSLKSLQMKAVQSAPQTRHVSSDLRHWQLGGLLYVCLKWHTSTVRIHTVIEWCNIWKMKQECGFYSQSLQARDGTAQLPSKNSLETRWCRLCDYTDIGVGSSSPVWELAENIIYHKVTGNPIKKYIMISTATLLDIKAI